ncbi:hypothetical protein J0J21_23400, partial [Vibrio vulnificus]|uniref:hypothetical protein n=1 Tax=Vibrio vulnificus TaxID=672 RepID=UPI0019D43D31
TPKKEGKKPNPPKPKEEDSVCFHCNMKGHWRKHFTIYLEEIKKNGGTASSLGIFVIEVNISISNTWVLDTGCGSHICSN